MRISTYVPSEGRRRISGPTRRSPVRGPKRMPTLSEAAIIDALRHVQEPELGRDIVSLEMVKSIAIDGTNVAFTIELTTPACPLKDEIESNARAAIQQFLRDVEWGDLDYLVVDLPPGTSDAQLTLAQSVPLGGAVLVTTPQEVALSDVGKALAMFKRLSVPILGLVENMTAFACPHCGELTEIGRASCRERA